MKRTAFCFCHIALMSLAFASESPATLTPQKTMAEVRKVTPALDGLSDESALEVLQRVYYRDWTIDELAQALGVTIQKKEKKELGFIDKWRFQNCQTEAAKAPTHQGVSAGLRVCNEKFQQ